MTPRFYLIILVCMVLLFVLYGYKSYRETGGYEINSDAYYGYRFPTDNNFTKVEDCQKAITEFPDEDPPPKEWMDGCIKYFEINN